MSIPTRAQGVLDFWFRELDPEHWFRPYDGLDEMISARFSALLDELTLNGVPDDWRETAHGRLAGVIVLDQFPRNIHRGTPRAHATDPMALILARDTVSQGLHTSLDPNQQLFLYMPFQHAEDLGSQAEGLPLFDSLGRPESATSSRAHYDVVERFGRFPHRNAYLGRISSPDEEAYIAEPGSGF